MRQPPQTRDSPGWSVAFPTGRFKKVMGEPTYLGHGTCGDVVKAWDSESDKYVAVKRSFKQLRPCKPGMRSLADCVEREYAILQKLSHPHLPAVLAGGRRNAETPGKDRAYLVTEWVVGKEIGEVGLGAAPRQAMLGVLAGLAHVHAKGFIHGDIHAGNILRTRDRTVLIDFDLSCAAEAMPDAQEARHEDVMAALALLTREALSCGVTENDSARLTGSQLIQKWLVGEVPSEEALRAHPFFAAPEASVAEEEGTER